jgi:Asp-tRNA(Asn)/Glu-tRNA(Gln) amidotransferase A subunit family amidase
MQPAVDADGHPLRECPGLVGPGRPLGNQIVARFGRDRFALGAAAFVEQALSRAGGG